MKDHRADSWPAKLISVNIVDFFGSSANIQADEASRSITENS